MLLWLWRPEARRSCQVTLGVSLTLLGISVALLLRCGRAGETAEQMAGTLDLRIGFHLADDRPPVLQEIVPELLCPLEGVERYRLEP